MDELWDSMCQTALTLISNALHEVDNAEVVLKIKGVIALFIQTMEVSLKLDVGRPSLTELPTQSWNYPVSSLDLFLLTLFKKYSELLRRRFSDDFQEVCSDDQDSCRHSV